MLPSRADPVARAPHAQARARARVEEAPHFGTPRFVTSLGDREQELAIDHRRQARPGWASSGPRRPVPASLAHAGSAPPSRPARGVGGALLPPARAQLRSQLVPALAPLLRGSGRSRRIVHPLTPPSAGPQAPAALARDARAVGRVGADVAACRAVAEPVGQRAACLGDFHSRPRAGARGVPPVKNVVAHGSRGRPTALAGPRGATARTWPALPTLGKGRPPARSRVSAPLRDRRPPFFAGFLGCPT